MEDFRQQIKELVTYILNPEERDEDVIENYTDTVMLACEEYHIKQLKLYGVSQQRELLIAFLEMNNWLSLEDEENAKGVVDCYLKAINCG